MDKMIVVGNDNFEKFIKDDGCYVDKTELIYDLAAKTRNEVTLFTRPRRFGKTLTMSMMDSFFDIGRDSKKVFNRLNIMKNHSDFCEKWMNKYPTLFISFKNVEGLTFKKAYAMLVGEIAKLCIKFAFLENENKVDPADAAVFHRLKFKEASEEEIKNSLQTVMRMMKAVYGKPVILLIDEYDVPLAKALIAHWIHPKQMLSLQPYGIRMHRQQGLLLQISYGILSAALIMVKIITTEC